MASHERKLGMELRLLRTKLDHEHGLEVSGIIVQANTERGAGAVGDM